jgi:hypothetical protein
MYSQLLRQAWPITGIWLPHLSSNASSAARAASGFDGSVDRPEVLDDLVAAAARDVAEALADQVHQAGLHRRGREDGLDRLGEALQPVDAADQDVADTAGLQVGQHLHPELGALAVLEPHSEHLALAVDRDRQREVAGLALHRASVPDLQHQCVEEHDRVDVIKRPNGSSRGGPA